MTRNLRSQLLFSHLLLVGLMVAVMLVSVAGFFRLGRSVDRILKDNYKSVVAAQNMKEALERQDSSATFFLAGQVERARKQYEENRPRFEAAYQIEATNVTEAGEQSIADDLGQLYGTYRRDLERLLYAKPPLPAMEARALYFKTLEPQFVRMKQRSQDVLDLNQAAIVRADERAREEARLAAFISIGVTGLAVVGALTLAWRWSGAIMTPLVSLTRQAEEIGAGRLNQRIEVRRTDEIGQLANTFNEMAEHLREARRVEEERLHRAERMSDAALENLYDPVIVTDAEGRVVHLNRAAEGLFGPDARARGAMARSVVREDRLAHAIERAVGQEHTSAEEGEAALISFQSGDAQRTYRLRATPMQNEDGTLLGAVAVLEDVTHLRELDRLKDEFIGVASHELRTPVTSLLLGVQLLQEGAVGVLSPAQQEVVNSQQEDLLRLERMMRDLLDITRLEAGANPPRFEMVTAKELIDTARQSVAAQARAHGVRLEAKIAGTLPPVRADRGQITRVLLNLLNNAIRHTPEGGEVAMEAIASDAAVTLVVRDTGTGIPPEYLQHIFERFVQVPGATRGGAGLGLSLAQSIIKAHGGEIVATSQLGKGSTFTFTLPTVPEIGK